MFRKLIFFSVLLVVFARGSQSLSFVDQLGDPFWRSSDEDLKGSYFVPYKEGTDSGKCGLCKIPLDFSELRKHYFESHSSKKCGCGDVFINFDEVAKHHQVCAQQRAVAASNGTRTLLGREDLERYIEQIKGATPPLTCQCCPNSSRKFTKTALLGHVRNQHDEQKRRICDLCGHEVMGDRNLEQHRDKGGCKKRQEQGKS